MFKNCENDSSQIIEMFLALNRTFHQVFLSTTSVPKSVQKNLVGLVPR